MMAVSFKMKNNIKQATYKQNHFALFH